MESPTFDSFDVAAVKIEASEECSNNANNTDFSSLCWLKKENQDQVDDVLMASEQKYQFNDDLNNILDASLIKVHHQDDDHQEEHVNLNNQNNLPCIKSELNGADGNNVHDIEIDIKAENNHILHETENENEKNNLVSFDDFGPETSVDEIVPEEEKLSDHEELVPMETTISSSPSMEVTANTFDELIFQEKAEEVIITPSSDLDDDSVDKQLSSVDNTNTISEVDEEEPEKMVFEHDVEDILKSPLKESEPEPTIDQNIIVEENSLIANSEHNFDFEIRNHEPVDVQASDANDDAAIVADIEDNKNIFADEQPHLESTLDDDTKANIVSESGPQTVQDSCEESDEEWNYMKAKEGQTEKENVLSEEFKENIEPVTEKEFSSVELKEQLDTTPSEPVTINTCAPIAAPASSEPVSPVVDDLQTTPDMSDESNFHLNPEAKEFVPTTYTASAPAVNEHDQQNGETNSLQVKQPYRHVFDDVVSQSPRKGRESNMDDFLLPAENDFDVEIANRPHELLEDDVQMPEEGEAEVAADIAEPAVEQLQHENELLIQNALDNVGMKDSLYVENTSSGFNNGEVDLLNTIQQLPTEVELEENNVLSNKEGLSLEIDEKDVISPSSEDTKEIVTEIEEKVQEMHIHETAVEPTSEDVVMDISHPDVDILHTEVSQPETEVSLPETEVLQPEISHPETEVLQPEISHPEAEVLQPEISHPEAEVSQHEISLSETEVLPSEILHHETEVSHPEAEISQPESDILEISQPIFEVSLSDVVVEDIKPSEETKPEEPVVEEKPIDEPKEEVVENGDINVEELNKKNLEESAKLDAPVKIEESKLLEATLGVVAVTAAATATIKASTAKKSPASKPATLFVAKKPSTTTTARKLGTTSTVSASAARPKTAPVKPTTERKPTTTTSRTTTVTAAKPRVDIKKTTTSTLSKPKEVTKTTEIKKTTTTTSARPTVPKSSSATQARPRPATATSGLTNGIAKTTTTSRVLSSTSSTTKANTTSAAAPKPRLSPRSTVSSTLRKTETLKSPSAPKTAAPLSSRIDSGLKNGRPATCPAKPSTLRATKPAVGTTSTTSNRSTVKTTTTSTITSQRKTSSPLDKKKTLAPATTLTSSARKSISLTKTPTKSPGDAKKPPPIQRPAVVDPVVLPAAEVAPEVATAPLAAAVDIPIA